VTRPVGAPCSASPYSRIFLVDLLSRQVIREHRLGAARNSGPVFIAASHEQVLNALDLRTGEVICKDRLPAGGQATPMTCISPQSGGQFGVIAASGHTFLQTRPGDCIVAYALPRE
jgi:quinoprotein glucose dehydrogenase